MILRPCSYFVPFSFFHLQFNLITPFFLFDSLVGIQPADNIHLLLVYNHAVSVKKIPEFVESRQEAKK